MHLCFDYSISLATTLVSVRSPYDQYHINVPNKLSYVHTASSVLTPRLRNILVSVLDARSLAPMRTI